MGKKFRAGPEKLSKAALFFARVLESRATDEEMEEAFENIKPIINKRGNHEFLLVVDKKQGFAAFLEMTPSEIWMEVSDDYNYAKTKISNKGLGICKN